MLDTGGAYMLGDVEVLLDAASPSGLAVVLQVLMLPVTSCALLQTILGQGAGREWPGCWQGVARE